MLFYNKKSWLPCLSKHFILSKRNKGNRGVFFMFSQKNKWIGKEIKGHLVKSSCIPTAEFCFFVFFFFLNGFTVLLGER